MKITGFSVRPYSGKWHWFLYIDGKVEFKGSTNKQFTALVAGCFKWAWENRRMR